MGPVGPQCFDQGGVEGGVVRTELRPQCLLGLGLVKKSLRHPGATWPQLQLRRGGIGGWRLNMKCRRLGVMRRQL
jgi:hypothetical protein